MNKKIIVEGLDYLDMVDQIEPNVSVDEYAAKMGRDSEIVTLSFIVKNETAGNDLVDWFERGYDWVLDASLSDGQLAPGQYLVFVEMKRRSKVLERIIELLEDLKTLTNMELEEWTVTVNEEEYEPNVEQLKQVITISPHEYRVSEEGEEELNEMRQKAGLEPVRVFPEQDAELKAFKSMAGL
jgi:hypothetical protein